MTLPGSSLQSWADSCRADGEITSHSNLQDTQNRASHAFQSQRLLRNASGDLLGRLQTINKGSVCRGWAACSSSSWPQPPRVTGRQAPRRPSVRLWGRWHLSTLRAAEPMLLSPLPQAPGQGSWAQQRLWEGVRLGPLCSGWPCRALGPAPGPFWATPPPSQPPADATR